MNTTATKATGASRPAEAPATVPATATATVPASGTGARIEQAGTQAGAQAGAPHQRASEILTPAALEFLAALHARFASDRHEVLAQRLRRGTEIADGAELDFLPQTAWIRDDPSWRVADAAPGLEDRRVELTAPAEPAAAAIALRSGANVWLADVEDSLSPTWANIIRGQLCLFDTVRADAAPTIVMRPRGWHLEEAHLDFVEATGRRRPASASLTDFGLYFWHNAARLIDSGRGPYFYLPKLESHEEARLWDEVFGFAEEFTGIAHGTIRATVLIETIQAAFQMEEILYELRDHCAGLNAGRWDYIFSITKTFRSRGPRYVLPDRNHVTMTVPFMRAYTELLVATCHKRGAHAIGGMSPFTPNRRDAVITGQALQLIGVDKRREAHDGFDGTWVAHPDFVAAARAPFDEVLHGRAHQLERRREDVTVTAHDLLEIPSVGGLITLGGVRRSVSVAIAYIESWLRGCGCVAIENRMEDASTAEICRAQLWQWMANGIVTAEGIPIDRALVSDLLEETVAALPHPEGNRFDDAIEVFIEATMRPEFPAFLTTGAYTRYLVGRGA